MFMLNHVKIVNEFVNQYGLKVGRAGVKNLDTFKI